MYGGYEGSVFGGIIEVGESLVLMEDALRGIRLAQANRSPSLNPCSNGRCSQSRPTEMTITEIERS